jgi:hypothetical protein
MIAFLKIILLSVVAAIVYGLVHDQITIRICPEYFTVFHPRIIRSDNLTLIALSWGVVATWWMGAGIGFVLALAARWGTWPRRTWAQLVPSIGLLLGAMAICAIVAGVAGYQIGKLPIELSYELPSSMYQRFMADWWAHLSSYGSGFFGGLGLAVMTLVLRYRAARLAYPPPATTIS